MRLGEGTLENGDAKDIRDKHNVSVVDNFLSQLIFVF